MVFCVQLNGKLNEKYKIMNLSSDINDLVRRQGIGLRIKGSWVPFLFRSSNGALVLLRAFDPMHMND